MENSDTKEGKKPSSPSQKNSLSAQIPKLGKIYSLAYYIYGIVGASIILGVFIFIILFFRPQKPISIALIFFCFLILLTIIFAIIAARRVYLLNIQPQKFTAPQTKKEGHSDEKIISYIAGILRLGGPFRTFAYLGTANIRTPENVLLKTNKRVCFVAVPMPAGDKIIATGRINVDVPFLQWLAAKKEIENKTKEIISKMTAEEIMQIHPNNYSLNLNEIKGIKIADSSQKLTFLTKEGKKYNYGVRDKENCEKAKKLFADLIKPKVSNNA